MYNILFSLYVCLFRLVSLFHRKARKMIVGQKNTWRILDNELIPNEKYLWFHASSLGEFEQGRPLIESIRARYPSYKMILSFYSPSGYEVRKNYQGADVVCYLPFDTKRNVLRFLNKVQPVAAFFIKYEFWPNYLKYLSVQKIPIYLISGIFRPSQLFFKKWGKLYRRLLFFFDKLFVQNQVSMDLLTGVGLKDRVVVCGDTRCDRVLAIAAEAKSLPVLDHFAHYKTEESVTSNILIAGSSWPEDEELFIPYFNEHPSLKMIIAPHQIHESHLQYIESLLQRPSVRYSKCASPKDAEVDCIIIDCFGLLSSMYRYGKMAYIGGGFGAGIHNTLEAAVYGIPVIFGPNYQKFDEAKALLACGGGCSIVNDEELEACLETWRLKPAELEKSGKAAGEYVKQSSGGTEIILNYLSKSL